MVNLVNFEITFPKKAWDRQQFHLRNGVIIEFASIKDSEDPEIFVNIVNSSVTTQLRNELKNEFVDILTEATKDGKSTTQLATLSKSKLFLSFAWCYYFKEDFEEDYTVQEMTERLHLMTDLFSSQQEAMECCRRFLLCTSANDAYKTASAIVQWRVNHEAAKERKKLEKARKK
jgi:hypothetical protein